MTKILNRLLTGCLLLCFCVSHAQDFSNKGKEFWLSYSYHVGMVNSGGGQPTMTLYITSDVATTYTVEIFGVTTLQNGSINPGQVVTVNVPSTYFINDEGLFSNKAIRVTAAKPVVVYSYITRSAASAATLCLPLNVLGKEYYSANFTQISNESNSNSFLTIVAVEDNTTIEVTPSVNTKGGWTAGNTYNVTLNKGQIYQVLGTTSGNNGSDLTGTKVRSIASGSGGCKRIAVFSGSGKIKISSGSCNGSSSDNLYQQLYPTGTWGLKYLTVPSYNRALNIYRIIINDPTTQVYLNGALIPAASFINGRYYGFSTSQPNSISADKPISVFQYFTTQQCDGNGRPYDPDMIALNPVEQNIDKVTLVSSNLFASATTYPHQHHMHVIMRNGGTGRSSFKLDGNPVPLSSWQTHAADPNYSYLYLNNVTQGYHRLESDSGFNAIAYGYADAETYGYSAGANVKDLYQFASIQNQYAIVNTPYTCKGAPFYFSMTFPYQPTEIKWIFGPALNAMGIADVTVTSPTFDSTWTVNGKQLYRYKLTTPYSINTVGTYPIRILAQNPTPDGCSGEQEINYDLEVLAKPTSDFTFTSNGCISDSVRFNGSSNAFGRQVTNWFWNFDDGQTGDVQNPAHLYSSAGSYDVSYYVATDIGCFSDTVTKTIVITDPPVAKFSTNAPYCAGKTIIFTDSSYANTPIVKWTWNFGDGSGDVVVNSNTTQTHTYTTAGSYTVTLQVENATGCKSTIYSQLIAVSPTPVANFSFGNGCLPNASVQFTNASSISDGTASQFTYLWNFGDGGNSPAADPSHTYNSVGPFAVKLTVTSNMGCVGDTTITVNSVYEKPQTSITAPAEICRGNNINFTETSSAPNSSVTQWQWNFGDGNTSTQQSPTHTYTTAGSFTVSLTVTSAVGCVSVAATKQVIVNELPTADFTPVLPNCVSQTIVFTNSSVANSGSINKWTWNFGDGSGTSSMANPTYVYGDTGTYNVTLQVETDKGCTSSITSKPVIIHPLPEAGFIIPGNCINDPITTFTDTSKIADGSQSQFTYLWNFGDPNASPANNQSTAQHGQHKYTATGDYTVSLTITSKDGCKDTVTQLFTLNGAVPVPSFTLQGGNQHCSNDSVVLINNSSVAPGRIVKIEIFWDYANDPTNKTLINYPAQGSQYKHLYPEFSAPASKNYVIRLVAYSGDNCLNSTQQNLTLLATPAIVFNPLADVCEDFPAFQVQASAPNLNGTGVFTGPGITPGGVFTPRTAGTGNHRLLYRYTAANGCSNVDSQFIRVLPVPVANAGPDRFVLEGGNAVLDGSGTGNGLSFTWTPATYLDKDTIAKPVSTPLDDITYTLTVTNSDGCAATDQVFVKVLKSPTIPNVFSPNGDGINDKWVIQYLESYPGATVELFNRYGQPVFRSVGYSTPWDGTFKGSPVPAGTYYYIIDPKNGRRQIAGYVDVIR